MSLSSMFALRYLEFRAKESTIAFMIKICFLSIFIGTTSLMVTLIIMNGFEKTISEKMQGINADITMVSAGTGRLDAVALKEYLSTNFKDAIIGISGSSIKQAIFDNEVSNAVVFIKGIVAQDEAKVCTIADKIVESIDQERSLENVVHGNHILVGKKLAEEFHLNVGDTFSMLVPQPNSSSSIKMTKKDVIIGGVFSVGLEEFDHNFAYMDDRFFRDIFNEDEGVESIALSLAKDYETQIQKRCHIFERCFWKNLYNGLMRKMPLSDRDEYRKIVKKLKKELPDLSVSSWKDLHPALVSSLKLEKYVMFFILALITLVASMNMISLLFMQIQQKRRDIAILKSMGMMQQKIKNIFLFLGMLITTTAMIAGLLVAGVIGYLLERYPFLQLPDVYFVSHLPARMEFELFFVVALSVLLLGFIATWIPARRIESINITQVLRQE